METVDAQLQAYLIDKFGSFLSEERRNTIEHVLKHRTKYIKVVLEDLIDPHNVNAIFRSGECLGIQNFHIIDNSQRFHVGKGVSKGATKWIDIHRHDQTDTDNSSLAIEQLRKNGYQILVTAPSAKATPLEKIDISNPFALVLGNETDGVSKTMLTKADALVNIPMYGFTESFNVSVAAAVILSHLVDRMHKEVENWQLSKAEIATYKYHWYRKCMARPDYYQKYYVNAYEQNRRV